VERGPGELFGYAFSIFTSKVVLLAAHLDVFSTTTPLTLLELCKKYNFHYNNNSRAARDYFDALISMGLLDRNGDEIESATYFPTPYAVKYLSKTSPAYVGGLLVLVNNQLYAGWARLEEMLVTGKSIFELTGQSSDSLFQVLSKDQNQLKEFSESMSSLNSYLFGVLAKQFDFSKYKTLVDLGGSEGLLSCTLASSHHHLKCTTTDRPELIPIAQQKIKELSLSDRVTATPLDFFVDPYPQVDIITMSRILHDWSLEKKILLLKKAYAALPVGGVFIAIDSVIDDRRRANTNALVVSLTMLVEFGDGNGFDYSYVEFKEWAKIAGFARSDLLLLDPNLMVGAYVAYKDYDSPTQ